MASQYMTIEYEDVAVDKVEVEEALKETLKDFGWRYARTESHPEIDSKCKLYFERDLIAKRVLYCHKNDL